MATQQQAWGGIDVGGSKILAVVLDAEGAVLGRAQHATPAAGGPSAVVEAIIEALEAAAREGPIEISSLAGVGVGLPGAVNAEAGTLAHAGNLKDWEAPYPIAAELAERLQCPVRLGNDVDVAVNGECRLGAGKGHSSLLGVWWGTGVGGGLVLDGKIWTGRGAAGEIGHMVVRRGGARCTCGRRGCLEAYVGSASLERRARKEVRRGGKTILFDLMKERGRERLLSGIWARALAKQDPLAVKLIERAIEMLAAGIASAINLVDVEAVVIGGGLGMRLGQPYVERIAGAMQKHLFVPNRPPPLSLSLLGDLAGAIGAALLAVPPDATRHWDAARYAAVVPRRASVVTAH